MFGSDVRAGGALRVRFRFHGGLKKRATSTGRLMVGQGRINNGMHCDCLKTEVRR